MYIEMGMNPTNKMPTLREFIALWNTRMNSNHTRNTFKQAVYRMRKEMGLSRSGLNFIDKFKFEDWLQYVPMETINFDKRVFKILKNHRGYIHDIIDALNQYLEEA